MVGVLTQVGPSLGRTRRRSGLKRCCKTKAIAPAVKLAQETLQRLRSTRRSNAPGSRGQCDHAGLLRGRNTSAETGRRVANGGPGSLLQSLIDGYSTMAGNAFAAG